MPPFGLGFGLVHPYAALGPTPPYPSPIIWLPGDGAGNTAHTWKDQSGNGYDFTNIQATDPTLGTVNGKTAYLFPGGRGTTQFENIGPAVTQQFTIAAMVQTADTSLNTAMIDVNYSDSYSMDYGATYGAEYWIAGQDILGSASGTVGYPADNALHVFALRRDASGMMYCYFDGTLVHAAVGPTANLAAGGTRYLGYFTYNSLCWSGYICEFAEWPIDIGSSGVATATSNLTAKWG